MLDLRIALIGHDALFLVTTQAMLVEAGYQPVLWVDGHLARSMIATLRPALVIVELVPDDPLPAWPTGAGSTPAVLACSTDTAALAAMQLLSGLHVATLTQPFGAAELIHAVHFLLAPSAPSYVQPAPVMAGAIA